MKLVQGQEDKNPVVIGRLGQDASKPTITFYGHYDVQPADEAGWKSNPFKAHARDGYIYARGASDNKVKIEISIRKKILGTDLGVRLCGEGVDGDASLGIRCRPIAGQHGVSF